MFKPEFYSFVYFWRQSLYCVALGDGNADQTAHQLTGIYLPLPLSQPCATTLSVRDKFFMKVLKRAGSSSFTLLIREPPFGGINLNQMHTKRFKGCSCAFPSDFWISHLECQERSLALLRRTDPNPGMNQGGPRRTSFSRLYSPVLFTDLHRDVSWSWLFK